MRAFNRYTVVLVAGALMLAACDNGHSGGSTSSGSSAALKAVTGAANSSQCNSFSPTPINGQTFPQDTANEVPTAINGSPSPLNC